VDKERLKRLKHLFWEYEFKSLNSSEDEYLIIKKVLSYGTIEDIRDLVNIFGKRKIKQFLLDIKGKGIDKRRLRFYQLIFDLPKKKVDSWIKDPLREIWNR